MRRINILPPRERRRIALPTATRTGVIGLLLILGAVSVMLMIALYLFYFIRLGNEQDRVAQLDQNITRQQTRIQDLKSFSDLKDHLDAVKPIADGIFRTRFPWDEFLRGLAFVIPDSTALNSLDGKATSINTQAPAGGTSEAQSLEPPGKITFTGVALPEYQNISDFIVRMNSLRFVANARLGSAELDRKSFARDAITFEVEADLITRIGENGTEVLINNESQDDNTGGDGANYGTAPQGDQASRAGVER